MDVASLAATAYQIADMLGSTPGAGGGVSAAADTLAEGLSGIAGMDTSMLTAAGTALRTVQPVTLLDQALQMVADVTSVDYLGVAGDFGLLGGQLLAGDIPAAHATAYRINNNLSPLVEAASKLPLDQVAQVLALIPDPVSQAAALVLLLDNVDVIGLAKAVGQLQEVAWQVVETGNPLALGQLLPIGLNLAHIALGVFTGGQETPASALHSGLAGTHRADGPTGGRIRSGRAGPVGGGRGHQRRGGRPRAARRRGLHRGHLLRLPGAPEVHDLVAAR
ncbi:hypothetical protein [Tomitella cavernea]|uniref:PE family protein n=1 Tax=Tomitella cavernea TaxID=1387982 RepID=A0ABP9D4Q4_9ACTN